MTDLVVPALEPPLPDVVAHPALAAAGIALRTWRASDAPLLRGALAANASHLRPWLPWIAAEPLTLAQREALFDTWEAERAYGGGAVYGIWLVEPGGEPRVVGGTGLHRGVAADGLEIGYWLAATAQGQGIATTVVRVLTELALAQPMIDHVEIRMDAANTRSAAVARRCGYTRQASFARPVTAAGESGTTWVWTYESADLW